jgi:Protein of unknown function (DUF3445)
VERRPRPRSAEPPGWLDEIDATPGPPFLAMGVRGLGPDRWLTPHDTAAKETKAHVLAAHHADVVVALDGAPDVAAAVEELARTVRAELGAAAGGEARDALPSGTDRPERPIRDAGPGADAVGQGAGREAVAGRVDAAPPSAQAHRVIEAAARPVAEDMCVLVPRDGAWVLGAACVCFPSHWRPADKLGRPVVEIHAPVPHYPAELAARVDRFLDRLAPGRSAWRRNWLVHTDDRLFAPVPAPPPEPPLTAADAGDRLWLRSERQTLTRLLRTGAIVFTIRTQQVPLAAVATHPDLRARLARAVSAWPPHQTAYRGGEALRRPLAAWLTAPHE